VEAVGKSWFETLTELNERIVRMQAQVSDQAARIMDALEQRHDIEAAEVRFQILNEELLSLRVARNALLDGVGDLQP
jgi:archaellum component FlaC